jgi:histidinol-phosphate aminotransferase
MAPLPPSSTLPYLRPDLAQMVGYTPNPGHGAATIALEAVDHLDTNECPYDLPPLLKDKLAHFFQHHLFNNRYPDGSHGDLKGELAAYVMESAGQPLTVTADHLTVGNGSDELIRSLIIATCVGGSGAVGVAEPTFSMYGIIAETLGVPVRRCGRSSATFALDLESAQTLLQPAEGPPLRLLFMVHPNSPTATALREPEIEWLRQVPPEVLVVIDEAYFEFSQTSLVAEALTRPNWIILRTFSKGFRLAAQRVGYGIGDPQLIATLERVRLPYNLPTFAQQAALVALQHRQDLLACVPDLLQERQRLHQAFSQWSALQVFPSDANFLFVQLAAGSVPAEIAGETLAQLCQAMQHQGTLIRHTGGGLRITVGSPEENDRTISRLLQALKGQGLA